MANNKLKFPESNGWYWILISGYESPTPCWFVKSKSDDESYFLAGGLGDGSSAGIYSNDIEKIGPEIIEPKF